MYVKDPFKLLITYQHERKKRDQKTKEFKGIYWSFKTIDDVYENLEGYNPTKKIKVLIVFDYMIPDMKANK